MEQYLLLPGLTLLVLLAPLGILYKKGLFYPGNAQTHHHYALNKVRPLLQPAEQLLWQDTACTPCGALIRIALSWPLFSLFTLLSLFSRAGTPAPVLTEHTLLAEALLRILLLLLAHYFVITGLGRLVHVLIVTDTTVYSRTLHTRLKIQRIPVAHIQRTQRSSCTLLPFLKTQAVTLFLHNKKTCRIRTLCPDQFLTALPAHLS